MAQRKLIRKEELDLFKKYGRQDGQGGDAIVVARLFHPYSNWTWYLTEYDSAYDEIFGFTVGLEMEWGTIGTLEYLRSIRIHGMKLERDTNFRPCTLNEALEADGKKYPYE